MEDKATEQLKNQIDNLAKNFDDINENISIFVNELQDSLTEEQKATVNKELNEFDLSQLKAELGKITDKVNKDLSKIKL